MPRWPASRTETPPCPALAGGFPTSARADGYRADEVTQRKRAGKPGLAYPRHGFAGKGARRLHTRIGEASDDETLDLLLARLGFDEPANGRRSSRAVAFGHDAPGAVGQGDADIDQGKRRSGDPAQTGGEFVGNPGVAPAQQMMT